MRYAQVGCRCVQQPCRGTTLLLVNATPTTLDWTRSPLVKDVEAGYAEPTERETLLAERRTSSTEEEVPTLSQDQSERIRSLELSNKRQSPQSSPPDEQNIQRDKLKGLGLAALTTVFTALTSVFAKITGDTASCGSYLVCS